MQPLRTKRRLLAVAVSVVVAVPTSATAGPNTELGSATQIQPAATTSGKPAELKIIGGGYEAAVDAPPATPNYTATFGDFLVCLDSASSAPAELTGVSYQTTVGTPRVIAYARTAKRSRLRRLSPAQRKQFLPSGATLGKPPDYHQPYAAKHHSRGVYQKLAGHEVSLDCKAEGSADVAIGRGQLPRTDLVELNFAVATGHTGASIHVTKVSYTSAGFHRSAKLDVTLTDCGDSPAIADECPNS